jgi:L-seryl-tRNA(Ser) seleniumtransferase
MQNLLKKLPKVDKILNDEVFNNANRELLKKIIQEEIKKLRDRILKGEIKDFSEIELINSVKNNYQNIFKNSLIPLINGTGVILHTNMGRSLISKEILNRASEIICNYSNLEYNLTKGERGERYEHINKHIKTLFNVEDVLIVNNNASAVFLILNTFAKNREVIVSRGELVEIGGSFRIPEVMKNSGAILREVGATNKTKINDYANEITDNTAILMKVHKSNFTIEGFSEEVEYSKIRELATENNIIDYFDLGSGFIPELPYNLSNYEASIGKILRDNPSLISFSGDKLFGSVQAGIILGKHKLIKRLKKNQLLRMLRVDKITLSILEETIKAYLSNNLELIPTLNLLFRDIETLEKRAKNIQNIIGKERCEVIKSSTFMGGGTLPNKKFPTIAIHIKGKATILEKKFRENFVIGRIENNKFLLDFRSIPTEAEEKLIKICRKILDN